MKVYLASEQKELSIRLANIINRSGNTCIMSDEDSDDYRSLLKDIRSSLAGYDLSILISKTPMEAAIEANKMGGVRATVCKDIEDAAAALQAKSNMIILDSSKVYRMDMRSIVKSIEDSFGGSTSKQRSIAETAAPKKERALPQQQAQSSSGKAAGSGIGGMFGSIKGALGMDSSGSKDDTHKAKAMQAAQKKADKQIIKAQKVQDEPPPKKKGKGGFMDSLKDTFGVE